MSDFTQSLNALPHHFPLDARQIGSAVSSLSKSLNLSKRRTTPYMYMYSKTRYFKLLKCNKVGSKTGHNSYSQALGAFR